MDNAPAPPSVPPRRGAYITFRRALALGLCTTRWVTCAHRTQPVENYRPVTTRCCDGRPSTACWQVLGRTCRVRRPAAPPLAACCPVVTRRSLRSPGVRRGANTLPAACARRCVQPSSRHPQRLPRTYPALKTRIEPQERRYSAPPICSGSYQPGDLPQRLTGLHHHGGGAIAAGRGGGAGGTSHREGSKHQREHDHQDDDSPSGGEPDRSGPETWLAERRSGGRSGCQRPADVRLKDRGPARWRQYMPPAGGRSWPAA